MSTKNNGVDAGQKLLIESDALAFLKAVKDAFQDEREKYDEFFKMMTDYKAKRIGKNDLISRVNELFKEHADLIMGFNTFATKGYKTDDAGHRLLTMNDALAFLKDVKVVFQNKREKYDEFINILKDYKAARIDVFDVVLRVKKIFKGHIGLILGFNIFLPKGYYVIITKDNEIEEKVVEDMEVEQNNEEVLDKEEPLIFRILVHM